MNRPQRPDPRGTETYEKPMNPESTRELPRKECRSSQGRNSGAPKEGIRELPRKEFGSSQGSNSGAPKEGIRELPRTCLPACMSTDSELYAHTYIHMYIYIYVHTLLKKGATLRALQYMHAYAAYTIRHTYIHGSATEGQKMHRQRHQQRPRCRSRPGPCQNQCL